MSPLLSSRLSAQRLFPLSLLSSALFLSVQPALAAPSPVDQGSSAVAPANGKLAEVKVTADAEPQNSRLSKTVLGSTELTRQQASNLADVVRYVPGVSVNDIGRFGSTGFNIRGMEGDQVAILVDGMALGESMDPDSHAPYEFFRSGRGGIDPDALKQVHILKGADAISAGSGSLGGAVLFFTKDAADFLAPGGDDGFARLKTEYNGANSEWLQSVTAAGRSGALESLLVLSRRDGNEMQSFYKNSAVNGPGRTAADPSSQHSNNLLFKLNYQLLPDHLLAFSLDQQQADSSLQNLSRQDQTYINRLGLDDSSRDKYSVSYDYLAASALFDTMALRYDHQLSRNHGLTSMLVTAPCPKNISPCLRSEDREFRQNTNQLTLAFDKELSGETLQQQWLYGLHAVNKNVTSSAVDRRYEGNSNKLLSLEVDPAFVPLTQVQQQAIYLRDTLLWPQSATSLTLGARYDQLDYRPELSPQYQDKTGTVKDVQFSAVTWQSKLLFETAENQQLTLQAGRGFRAPTVEEMYLQTSTTSKVELSSKNTVTLPTAVSNPNLQSEQSLNLELGYQWQLPNSQHKLELFRNSYTDLIETNTLLLNPQTSYQSCSMGQCTVTQGSAYTMAMNSGEADVHGVELSGHWQQNALWRLNWSGSWQQGEKANGDPMLSISPWSAVFGVAYQLNDNLRLQLHSRYQAAKAAKDATETNNKGAIVPAAKFLSNSAALLDLAMQWDLSQNLALHAGIFNLLDKQYYRWERVRYVTESVGAVRGGVSGDGISRYSEPGRYGKVTVSYSF